MYGPSLSPIRMRKGQKPTRGCQSHSNEDFTLMSGDQSSWMPNFTVEKIVSLPLVRRSPRIQNLIGALRYIVSRFIHTDGGSRYSTVTVMLRFGIFAYFASVFSDSWLRTCSRSFSRE